MQNGTCGRPVACLQEGDRLPDCPLSQAGRGSAHGLPAVAGVVGGSWGSASGSADILPSLFQQTELPGASLTVRIWVMKKRGAP